MRLPLEFLSLHWLTDRVTSIRILFGLCTNASAAAYGISTSTMWRSLLMDSTTIIIRCLSEKATSCKRDKAKFLKSSKRSHQIAQDIQYDSSEGTPSTDDEDDETGRRGRVGMEGTLSERELVDYLTDMTNFSRLFLRGQVNYCNRIRSYRC